MNKNALNDLTSKMHFGDKVMFKHNFDKWKLNACLPTNDTSKSTIVGISPSPTFSCTSITENDVENPKINVMDILKQHKTGCKILEFYAKNNKITADQRAMLISIIVEYFESNDIHMYIQASYNVENQILKLFPTEKLEYYRTERRGKIYTKYNNNKRSVKSCLKRNLEMVS